MKNFTAAQLTLDFKRCAREWCGTLDKLDWIARRFGCRKCGSRSVRDPEKLTEEEEAKIAAGWFEDEANA